GIRDLIVTGVQTCALPISVLVHSAARVPAALVCEIERVMLGIEAQLAIDRQQLAMLAQRAALVAVRHEFGDRYAHRDAFPAAVRSEERRVGKEGGCRWSAQ